MKYRIPLAISLALNAILIGAYFLAPQRPPAPTALPSPEPPPSPRPPRIAPEPEQISQPTPARASANAPSWQQSIQQLHSAGVPRNVLAGLVAADFEIRWQKQLLELERRYQAGEVDDAERSRFEARRDQALETELRAALGDEGFRQWDKGNQLRDLDLVKLQLSSSETDALYQLRKDRARLDHALSEAFRNGEIDEADYNERQSAAQREYDERFKMLLGDERYKALQDSEEGLEGALRQQTQSLSPDDAQLAAMVAAERDWNRQRAQLERRARETPDHPRAYEEQLQALDAARDRRYRQVLTTNDFDQLQRNQDRRYRLLTRYARAWSLSESDIDYIYSSIQNYPQQHQSARDEIAQSLAAYLGPERFERLKANQLFDSGEQ